MKLFPCWILTCVQTVGESSLHHFLVIGFLVTASSILPRYLSSYLSFHCLFSGDHRAEGSIRSSLQAWPHHLGTYCTADYYHHCAFTLTALWIFAADEVQKEKHTKKWWWWITVRQEEEKSRGRIRKALHKIFQRFLTHLPPLITNSYMIQFQDSHLIHVQPVSSDPAQFISAPCV